jgi:hypothetical protein
MNVGYPCSYADTGRTFELPDLANPSCPECTRTNVLAVRQPPTRKSQLLIAAAVMLVALSAVAGYFYFRPVPIATAETVPPPATAALHAAEVRAELDRHYRDGPPPSPADVERIVADLTAKYKSSMALADVQKIAAEVGAPYDRERAEIGRAMAFVEKGTYGEAASVLREVVAKRPTNTWALANLCAAYLRLNRRADATSACEGAVRTGPRNWLAHYNLATLRVVEGRTDEAVAELQKSVDLVSEGRARGMTRAELTKQMKTDVALTALRPLAAFSKLTEVP